MNIISLFALCASVLSWTLESFELGPTHTSSCMIFAAKSLSQAFPKDSSILPYWDNLILTNFNVTTQKFDQTLDISSTFYGAQTFVDFANQFSNAIDRNINMRNENLPYIQAIKASMYYLNAITKHEEVRTFVDTYNDILNRYKEYFALDKSFQLNSWVKTAKAKSQPDLLFLNYPLLDSLVYVEPTMAQFDDYLNEITLTNTQFKRSLSNSPHSEYKNQLLKYLKENARDSTLKSLLGVGSQKRADGDKSSLFSNLGSAFGLRNIRATSLTLSQRERQGQLNSDTSNIAGNLQNDRNNLVNTFNREQLANPTSEILFDAGREGVDVGTSSMEGNNGLNHDTVDILNEVMAENFVENFITDIEASAILKEQTLVDYVDVLRTVGLSQNTVAELKELLTADLGLFDIFKPDQVMTALTEYLNSDASNENKRRVMRLFSKAQRFSVSRFNYKIKTSNDWPKGNTYVKDNDFRLRQSDAFNPEINSLIQESTTQGRIDAAIDNMMETAGIDTGSVPLSNSEAARAVLNNYENLSVEQRSIIENEIGNIHNEFDTSYGDRNEPISNEDNQLHETLESFPATSEDNKQAKARSRGIMKSRNPSLARQRTTAFRATRASNPRG